jgi:hypothetical protein
MTIDNNELKRKKENGKGFPIELKLFFVALFICVIVLLLKIFTII